MAADRTPTPPLDVDRIRRDFPVLQQQLYGRSPLVYLDSAASSHRPAPVLEAMQQFEQTSYANVHRGNHWLSESASSAYEQSRESLRRFLGCNGDWEVIFTSGTTAAINLVARAWGDACVRAGDEILLTVADHHSNIVPWQQLAGRTGARLVWYDHAIEAGIDPNLWARQITPRTRLATWPAVSNVLGFRAPTSELAAIARQRGVVTLVDAAQHVPHEPTDLSAWQADFVAFSGHKMFGPTGIGVLCGRRELLENMPPFLGGGSMIGEVTRDGFSPAGLPARFEAGTPPIVQAVGLAAAANYLDLLGLEQIRRHGELLTGVALEHLRAIPGIRIPGPPAGSRAAIISLAIDGVNSQDLAKLLDLKGIAVRAGHHCAMPLHESLGLASTLRASFCAFNTVEEAAALGRVLATAAARLRR